MKTQRECAPELRLRKAMWPRETTARSGDIGCGIGSPRVEPMSSGFAAEHRRCDEAKNTKSSASRTGSVGSTRQQDPDANNGVAHGSSPIRMKSRSRFVLFQSQYSPGNMSFSLILSRSRIVSSLFSVMWCSPRSIRWRVVCETPTFFANSAYERLPRAFRI
jgi:hypothetical protein